jgi:hypothetical protein
VPAVRVRGREVRALFGGLRRRRSARRRCSGTKPPPPRRRSQHAELRVHALWVQGVDLIAGGRNKSKHRTAPKSENVYLLLLVKVSSPPARRRLKTHGLPLLLLARV